MSGSTEEKIERVRRASREFEAALEDFGPGLIVRVDTFDPANVWLMKRFYGVRVHVRPAEPIEVYP